MKNQRLIDLRDQRGLTQQQLADLIGISQGMVARIESGDRDPRTNLKVKLAQFFEVTVEWLFYKQYQYPQSCTGTNGN